MFDPEEVLRHAVTFFDAGQFGEAEELCRHVLQEQPEHPGANYLLGLIMLERGQPELALPVLQSAREAAPQEGGHWLALGECLLALGRFDEVDAFVKQAVKSGHASPQMQELRVRAKRGKERKEPPAAIKDEILALFRAQRAAELEARARAALEQYPGWVLGWSALGAALSMVGKDAETAMRLAMQLAPQSAEVHNNLGVHLRERGRAQEALELFRQAIRLRPKYVEAHFNLGAALSELGHYKEAKVSFDRALAIKPDYFDAMVEASIALIGLGREHEAMEALRRVLKLNPANPKAYTNLLFGLLHRGDLDAGQIFAEHKRFGDQFDRDANPAFGNVRDTERCLRIGIVSGDFRHHAVASFLEPLLAQLVGSQRLSLHAYYNYSVVDATTNRLKGFFASWNMVAGMSDDDLVHKIRADGIDILIDLSGHTAHNRLLTFARRAAPVQASWIGYPGTTGLRSMDYYLGDRHFLPSGMFDAYFTEKIVRLPANAPFLPVVGAPDVNDLPALRSGQVTFGSFNRLSKISRPVVALWSRLLRESPDSRMVLGGLPSNDEPAELLGWFAEEGISRERLTLLARTDMVAYAGQHHQVDICLDTFPYNGGTTTCHAAWMGVPTLTQAGETVTGRVGAAILGHLGLDEFVAHDAEEFVRKGMEWAGRLEELSHLRQGMRERFANSALGRPELIATGLERALHIMWRRWCDGLPPESFDVDGAGLLEGGAVTGELSLLEAAAGHYAARRLEEAERLCVQVLELHPGHPDASYNLGLIALERGRAEEALPHLHAAWEASPQEGQYWQTLGECLLSLGHFDETRSLADEAMRRGVGTSDMEALRLRAERGLAGTAPPVEVEQELVGLFREQRFPEVEARVQDQLRRYPGWAFGWKALGAALGAQEKNGEAAFRRSVALSPLDYEAHRNLGLCLQLRGLHAEALESYRRALEINPDDPQTYHSMLYCLTHVNFVDAAEVFAEHRRFGARFEAPLMGKWTPHPNVRDPGRRLKIGGVSGDFNNHAVARFIEPVLMYFAKSPDFEWHAYYSRLLDEDITQRLKELFASWNEVGRMDDDELARKIRADGIDILIDLSGHTEYNRLLAFARRPAPVQASWIGYPGTTGLTAMDYYLGDRYFLPPGQFDGYFTEKIVRLPANAPFLPEPDAPPLNELPALKSGYVTFGSFNRPSKINRETVALWAEILRRVPHSRMLLGAMPVDDGNATIANWFGQEGIASDRLIFHPRSGMRTYLGLHHLVDICLDTFPYNGGTTTCHAAWMGVPTLTLAGETVTGRVGAAILGHLGLDEFIVHDAEEFVRKGVEWAGRLEELAQLRQGMRERFLRSPLGLPEVIAAGLERALRIMWRRWCEGLPPESFEVDIADTPVEMLRHAAEHYHAGRRDEAEAACHAILQQYPGHPDASYNLGLMALERGSPEEALPHLHAAWEGSPQEEQYWLTLGQCLLEMGHFDEVLALADEAIRRGIDTPAIRHMRLLGERGRDRAEPPAEVCQAVVSLFQAARHEELESRAEETLREYPGWVLGWNALGMARAAMGKDAAKAAQRAVELGPEDAEAHNNLGVFLRDQGRREEALESFRRALRIRPEFVEANFNLGATLQDLGRLEESIASFRRVVEIKPDYVGAWASLGSVLKEQGEMQEAIRVLRRVLDAEPDHVDAWDYLLFGLIHCDDIAADVAFAEHCRYGEHFEGPLRGSWPASFDNSREVERVLRVGFVSGDFFLHAVTNFIEPVLTLLARSPRLQLHAYYNHAIEDASTERLKRCFARWNKVAGIRDDDLAQKIRTDGIDILVDLSGHSGRNRLLTFARRPAPVQASWIGYPGTTGLTAMDYYLGDRYFLPPGQFDRYFTEKIVRLPANAPFMPDGGAPPINELPALEKGYVTFGSFNRISKISPAVVSLWARLLRALPESRMLLGGLPTDSDHEELIGWFAQGGVGRERLLLHPKAGMNRYMALHQEVDICLDTFPYNGGTTTCHAAWMGVPTLTLAGETVTGRVGAAILGHLGLDEFVVHDTEEFVRKGVEWAGRLEELAQLRQGMRERFLRSPLGLPEVIAAGLERALRIMWRRWCEGLPPESFEVDIADTPVEMLRHAAEHYHAGRREEAEAACRAILQQHPGHPDASYNLGLMALERGSPEEALPLLHAAWEASPQEEQYWQTLGECLLEMGHFDEAQALAEEAIRRGMDTPGMRQVGMRALGGRAMANVTGVQADG